MNLLLLRPNKNIISPDYLNLISVFYRHNGEFISVAQHAINQSSINQKILTNIQIPLPPLPEQLLIVSAVEALFSRMDATNQRLNRMPEIIKRFRQSVLASACNGRLVPTEAKLAQKEGRDYESADILLNRILRERKEKLNIDNKKKYKEPITPDISSLPKLPEGWVWSSMDQLLVDILAGKSFKCDERPPSESEVGVVKISSVTWGEFDENESKTCLDPDKIREDFFIKEGNFLFSRANTIELIGACVIVKQISKKLMLSDKILRFSFANVPSEWILINLRSVYGRSEIERLSTGNQLSMRNIGQDRIRQIRIPLPPLSEQHRIASRVNSLFAYANSVEAKVAAAKEKTETLRQSILAKAFSGELVPTEAELARKEGRDFESAEMLLQRINESRVNRNE